ncbi:MAG: hypothetical protein K5790_10340 [Nitrosopumilus sp.]|uniref:hypothetical protein n=1 Tax=Nitrosopumilus sp. TaxID=2024843 RepID=UPI00247BAD0F|nr:hypothetical protein [Nitrosopumilus sp.]MCV0393668.1 hypothetical protein [Nitrosopumilus sp.]
MKKKKKPISGGKRNVIIIGLIRIHWFGGVCMWDGCNAKHDLEFAHAIETELSKAKNSGRSSWERLCDLLTNPECFLLYCAFHHRIFDNRIGDVWKEEFYKK